MFSSQLGSIGDRLTWLLKDLGLTQGYLAGEIGSTQAAVSQWCTGKKIPSAENINAIVDCLGIRKEWLVDGSGPIRAVNPAAERRRYGAEAIWGFREAPADGGRDFGNANVWSFDPTIEAFIREVLQNALDAALPGGGPVTVRFRLVELSGQDLLDYQQALKWNDLRRHLEASTRNQQKLGALIRDGLDVLEETRKTVLLIIEDSGTTGLVGPETGEGKFAALCRNNLDSNKDDAPIKGGAFGLGKGVLWRASRFATVLFCSDLAHPDHQGNQTLRLMGRCDLPWHEVNSQPFAGPGWFGRSKAGNGPTVVSFWSNPTLASDLYLDRKDIGSGTSVCVVGFHDPSSDEPKSPRDLAAEIEKAAAAHFFPAMTSGALKVRVETYSGRVEYVSGNPCTSVEVSVQQHQPEFFQALQAFQEGVFADRLKTPGDVVCHRVTLRVPARKVPPKHDELEHDAILLVRYASEGEEGTRANRLAMFRGPGMVVMEQPLSGICLGCRPFHALLLCGLAVNSNPLPEDSAAEEFLRTAEPPSHNKWTATPDLKAKYQRGCVGALTSFLTSVKEMLREIVKPSSRDLGDGPNSLRELFRLGTEPIPVTRERPRVVDQSGAVIDGQWQVEAKVRLKPVDREILVSPAVLFVGETGGGLPVKWERLEGVANCTAEGFELRIPPRVREFTFRGATNPDSHPVPASQSSVVIDIRKVVKVAGGNA
uniref:XRE family transcriptional regulator n=1 Tax=Schlesneria paludicola TaxID=360056 RepID=A0A7C4LML3_9PLAN